MRVITSFDDLEPVPWANGAGQTTELVSLADSAALTPDLARWRLSIARLERPAQFSPLPGLDRTFLPTGAEVVLDIDGHVHRVSPDEPARFHGDQSVSLIELGTPCFAVNLMVESPRQSDPGGAAGSESSESRRLRLTRRLTAGGRFAITLDEGAGYERFQLLELEDSDVVPDGLQVAILH